MSLWTHVTGAIYVNMYSQSNEQTLNYARHMLNNAPKVTGSEGDMQIYVNLLSGYNHSEFDNGTNRRWQTGVIISLVGDLRDRTIEKTNQELKAFLNYIKDNQCFMRSLSVSLVDNLTTYTYDEPNELGTPLNDEDY